MQLGDFTSKSCSDDKKCIKQRDARAKLIFFLNKNLAFCMRDKFIMFSSVGPGMEQLCV